MTNPTAEQPSTLSDGQATSELQPQAATEEELALDIQDIRDDVLFEASLVIDEALDDARRRFSDREHTLDELLTFIRIELGLEHARGPHHRAPGIDSRIQGLS